ncbi:hypothetical protein MPSEU_000455600 [Mayamaea pseudoterrestris]|nr:hypothetical protein MPSEU_000455600 [Mayamaea pseudoterrestris]
MGSRFKSTDSSSRNSQSLFDYVLQRRQELRHQQPQQPHHHQQQALDNNSIVSPSAADAWSYDNDDAQYGYTDSAAQHRSNLKRTMSRRGAIGFACALTQSCIETTNYFYDQHSDDSFVPPLQKPPERTGSSAKKRCRLGRAESSGSHQRHLEDATDQFAAVAITELAAVEAADDSEELEMERSVRRRMHHLEDCSSHSQHSFHLHGNSSHHCSYHHDDSATATAASSPFKNATSIDTAGHFPVGPHLLQKQSSFWSIENDEMQHSSSGDSSMTMDDDL